MIEKLLDPLVTRSAIDRLLKEAKNELRLLERGDESAKKRADVVGGSSVDLDALKKQLVAYKEAAAVGDKEERPLWMPRDPTASLIHSIYDEFFEDMDMVKEPDEDRSKLAGNAVAVSDRELADEALEFLGGSKKLWGRWFTRFGERDGRFLSWGAAAKFSAWLRGNHPFPKKAATTYTIGDRDRVVLVGDWGSGVPRARQVGTAMRSSLEQALREGRKCHVIHLGDVYYTGQEREYRKRFLDPWPVYSGDDPDETSSWCLNANHDMYSGGHNYFNYLLNDKRFARQENSSQFSLENSHWRVLGLDTAYVDGDLQGDQAAWMHQVLSQDEKNGILLSHHQPFSPYEGGGEALLQRVGPILRADLVRAWFWGHEHRCALYARTANIEYPRLIGHGGVPVWSPKDQQPGNVTYQYGMNEHEYFYRFGKEKFLRFGFVELTFEGETIDARYVTELGKTVRGEIMTKKKKRA